MDEEMNRQAAIQELLNTKQDRFGFERWLLDDELELLKLQASLTGHIYDEDKRVFIDNPQAEGLMNDKGAKFYCWTYLYPLVKNGKLTWLDTDKLKNLMYLNGKQIINHTHYNAEKYGIEKANIPMVCTIIITFLDTVLSRSLGGKERERLQTTQRFISRESYSANPGHDDMQLSGSMEQPKKRWGIF